MTEYECALTGVVSSGDTDDDGVPVGWSRVHITRRQYNPSWLMLQSIKSRLVHAALSQSSEETTPEQEFFTQVHVDATFHSLEQSTPMYVNDIDDVVYISDSGEIVETLNDLRGMLGLAPLAVTGDEGGAEEVKNDDDDDAPAGGE